eukprot:gene34618-41921_t
MKAFSILCSLLLLQCAGSLNWLRALGLLGRAWQVLETDPRISMLRQIDATGEAGRVSTRGVFAQLTARNLDGNSSTVDSPHQSLDVDVNMVYDDDYAPLVAIPSSLFPSASSSSSALSALLSLYAAATPSNASSLPSTDLQQLQRLSRRALRRLPDLWLVGALALIGTELAQRQLNASLVEQLQLDAAASARVWQALDGAIDSKLDALSGLGYDLQGFAGLELRDLRALLRRTDLLLGAAHSSSLQGVQGVLQDVFARVEQGLRDYTVPGSGLSNANSNSHNNISSSSSSSSSSEKSLRRILDLLAALLLGDDASNGNNAAASSSSSSSSSSNRRKLRLLAALLAELGVSVNLPDSPSPSPSNSTSDELWVGRDKSKSVASVAARWLQRAQRRLAPPP